MRRIFLALVILTTACTGPAMEPLRLGVMAEPGSHLHRAAGLAAAQAGRAGSPVELVAVPPGAQAADRLAEVPVHAVVLPADPSNGGETVDLAAAALLKHRIPGIVAGPPPTEGFPHLLPGPASEGRTLADLLGEEGITTIALLVTDDRRHRVIADGLETAWSGNVAVRVPVPPAATEVTGPLQEISVADSEAVVCACDRISTPALLRDAFVLGLAGRPWYHTGQARDPSLAEETFPGSVDRLAGQRGAALTTPDPTAGPAFEDFAQAYRELTGTEAEGEAALVYDATWLLILAARIDGPDRISRHLSTVSRQGAGCSGSRCLEELREGRQIDYLGASGPIDLAEDGSPVPVRVEIWRFTLEGEVEVLETRSYRSGGLGVLSPG